MPLFFRRVDFAPVLQFSTRNGTGQNQPGKLQLKLHGPDLPSIQDVSFLPVGLQICSFPAASRAPMRGAKAVRQAACRRAGGPTSPPEPEASAGVSKQLQVHSSLFFYTIMRNSGQKYVDTCIKIAKK